MQKRMMNCIQARSWCEPDTWAYNFWQNTLDALMENAAMPKRDWYNLYNLQPDSWLEKNSTRTDGLFTPFKQRIMKLVLRDRANTPVY